MAIAITLSTRRVERGLVWERLLVGRVERVEIDGLEPPLATELVDRAVDRDPAQPRAERTVRVEAVEGRERPGERLLRYLSARAGRPVMP